MGPSPRRRQTTAQTKLELLQTGHRLLVGRGYRERIDIRLADVVHAAGYTTGAAYRIWESQESYQRDLAHFIAMSTEWAGVQAIVDDLSSVLERDPSFEEMVREAGNLYMSVFLGREEFYTLLYFHTVRELDGELAGHLVAGYQRIHEGMRELFLGLLALYDREMRAPFVIDDLCLAASVLAEGMALRHRIEPEVVDQVLGASPTLWHPFSSALLAVGLHYTQPVKGQPASAANWPHLKENGNR